MNPLTKQFVDIAKSQVGVREEGGNNIGKQISEYQKATWLPVGPWPWCCAFVAWVMMEFEIQGAWTTTKDVTRCKGANVNDWLKWAKDKGHYITDEKEPAKAGDIVIYDFGHVGIIVADQLPGKDYIETIEGNTTGRDTTLKDSITGDGVWTKTRKTNLVRNYIRFLPQDAIT